MDIDPERIKKLPRWVQNYIEDLQRQIDQLEVECCYFADEISEYKNEK